MSDALALLQQQWPIISTIIGSVGTGTGILWRSYWNRERKREDAEKKRSALLDAQAREDKLACESRLKAAEAHLTEILQGCVTRNTEAMAENSASNRELSGAVDRLTRAVSERPDMRDPAELTPPQGIRR